MTESGARPLVVARELVVIAKDQPVARDRLVDEFLPVIGDIARARSTGDHAELTQAGVVGLLRALDRYDPEFGTPFWAYASWWVRHAVEQFVAGRG